MKYCKKPLVIEAFKFRVDDCPDWFMDKVSVNEIISTETEYSINTLEGWMVCQYGDYIIKGIAGEIYPCRADIFEASYEKVIE